MKLIIQAALLICVVFSVAAAGYFWIKLDHAEMQLAEAQAQIAAYKEAAETPAQKVKNTEEALQQEKEKKELLQLRGEVTQLRNASNQVEKLRSENQTLATKLKTAGEARVAAPATAAFPVPGDTFTRDNWSFAGYDTPESTLVSAIWAMKEGDPKAYVNSLTTDEAQRMAKNWEGKTAEQIVEKQKNDVSKITGIKIVDKQPVSDSEVQMSVYIQGVDMLRKVTVRRGDDGWKFSGFMPEQAPKK